MIRMLSEHADAAAERLAASRYSHIYSGDIIPHLIHVLIIAVCCRRAFNREAKEFRLCLRYNALDMVNDEVAMARFRFLFPISLSPAYCWLRPTTPLRNQQYFDTVRIPTFCAPHSTAT